MTTTKKTHTRWEETHRWSQHASPNPAEQRSTAKKTLTHHGKHPKTHHRHQSTDAQNNFAEWRKWASAPGPGGFSPESGIRRRITEEKGFRPDPAALAWLMWLPLLPRSLMIQLSTYFYFSDLVRIVMRSGQALLLDGRYPHVGVAPEGAVPPFLNMVLYNNKKLLAALGGYQRHDGHYVCNLHSVPCTSPGLATVVAEVSREKKRVILKRKLNLLHVEYED